MSSDCLKLLILVVGFASAAYDYFGYRPWVREQINNETASFEKMIKNDVNNCTAAQKQQISNTLNTYKGEAVEYILNLYDMVDTPEHVIPQVNGVFDKIGNYLGTSCLSANVTTLVKQQLPIAKKAFAQKVNDAYSYYTYYLGRRRR
ncbi:hypothetical protein PRIPAC_77939 [Pristionchus pacificus]|uniref:Uncharacterized protein n=1 Tax=Pristionchus pacificus TaxID=54126 RepID=A0A2A6BHZ7_PRIPA|nr:hypothetical protein PRIPAC_77939 [Pristionchus pacificus]|eukprot:PDM65431.1 hypothetical protein PRIPAC_52373 [Pristionchus pacificus]